MFSPPSVSSAAGAVEAALPLRPLPFLPPFLPALLEGPAGGCTAAGIATSGSCTLCISHLI